MESVDEMNEAFDAIHDEAVKVLHGTPQEMRNALDRIIALARYKSIMPFPDIFHERSRKKGEED